MSRIVIHAPAGGWRSARILVAVALISLTVVAVISPETVATWLGAAYFIFHGLAASAVQ